jgi:uncharacterized protein
VVVSTSRIQAAGALALLEYRRLVAALYETARHRPGDRDAWRTWRRGRDELFASHPQSALEPGNRAGFNGLAYYTHDPGWVLKGTVEEAEPEILSIAHSKAGTTAFVRFGRVRFTASGRQLSLSLYWLDGYAGGLFLPFSDATSGSETYGGGRYLFDTAKGADLGHSGSSINLDFNYAYHPSCVHSDRWSCPLAPEENRLDLPVRAGERLSEMVVRDVA